MRTKILLAAILTLITVLLSAMGENLVIGMTQIMLYLATIFLVVRNYYEDKSLELAKVDDHPRRYIDRESDAIKQLKKLISDDRLEISLIHPSKKDEE
jgi:hypothetical protein|tara:strand:- start:475 stop:768 length:294 start_codon:yes stop_codon:yes gene_type:complete